MTYSEKMRRPCRKGIIPVRLLKDMPSEEVFMSSPSARATFVCKRKEADFTCQEPPYKKLTGLYFTSGRRKERGVQDCV